MSTLIILGSLFLVLNLFIIIGFTIPTNDAIGRNVVITIFLLFLPAYLIYIFGFFDWTEYLPISIIFITYIVLLWALPLFTHIRENISYKDKLKKQGEIDASTTGLWDIVRKYLGNKTEIVMILLFLILIAYYRGRAMAKQETFFPVIQSKEPMVVLKLYANKAICTAFNRNDKKIKNQFTIIEPFTSHIDNPLIIKIEKIGPLVLEKTTL